MSDIDINRVQQNIKELQDQNAIDFQQWKRLGQEIKRLEGKIKTSDTHLNLLMKKIKADYESLRKVIIDENVQLYLNNKIDENKKELVDKINMDKIEINEELNAIVNNSELTYAKKDDLLRLSTGTPLFASSVSEMTDTTRNYVNTTDGFLYTYNGESWIKTTVQYQSSGIADNSITLNKINSGLRDSIVKLSGFETLSPSITEGYFYNRYTLEKEQYSGFICCDIPVNPGEIYKITFSSWGESIVPILIKNSEGEKVLSKYDGESHSSTVEEIMIPDNSTTLCVSSSESIIIEKLTYFSKVQAITLENLPEAVLKSIGTKDFGTLNEGVCCFVDDDGMASLLTNTKSVIEEYQIPMTFAIWSWCDVMADEKREVLKSLLDNYNCEIALHTTGPMNNKTENELTNLIESEIATFKKLLNIDLKSYVYGYNASDYLLRAVASNYFNICASGGYTINNKRTNIYEMCRIWVDDSKSLQDYKNIIDIAKNNKQAVIFFWHSNELNNSSRMELVKQVVSYAKTSGIKITTLNGLYNSN